jgi:hypothetical protein
VELDPETCGSNHSYGEWTEEAAATCDAGGVYVRTCSNCFLDDYRYTDALGHSYTSVSQDATCTEDGFVTKTCSVCGDVNTEIIPAPGHSWNEATCTVAKTCWVCGTVEGEALGHGHTLGTGLASNGNDTHRVICGDCGETLSTEPCVYDKQNHLCDCGAAFSGF